MDNNDIIKIVCDLQKIDLTNLYPINECGEKTDKEFDVRFSLDRIYQYEWKGFGKRIRFVRYPNNDFVTILKLRLKKSNIIMGPYNDNENLIYYKDECFKIKMADIERPFKLKKIMEKMGR